MIGFCDWFTNCIIENMHIFDESFENGTYAISYFLYSADLINCFLEKVSSPKQVSDNYTFADCIQCIHLSVCVSVYARL